MDEKNRKVFKSFVMVTQIGISMMVPIFLCAALGVWLNRITGADACFLVAIFIGIGAAFRNMYVLTKSFYSKDMKEEHDRLEYIRKIKEQKKSDSAEPKEEYVEMTKTKRYPENRGPTRS